MSKDDKIYYVDPIELRRLIREYKRDLAADSGHRMSDELGICLIKIAKRFTSQPCFSDYSYREDFESAAIEKMIKAVEKIDPDDSRSPFAYLTQTCFRSVINYIKKEKKYQMQKDRIAEDIYNQYARENGLKERHNKNLDDECSGSGKAKEEIDGNSI